MGVVVIVRMAVLRIVAVGLPLDVDVARHHEIAVLDADDLDLRPIKARKHRPGNNFIDRADHRGPRAELVNPVNCIDQRIELVGAEQNGDLEVVANAPRDFDDALLVSGIERDQRLIEQQQARPADQRLA